MKMIREVWDEFANWLLLGFVAGIASGVALAYFLE